MLDKFADNAGTTTRELLAELADIPAGPQTTTVDNLAFRVIAPRNYSAWIRPRSLSPTPTAKQSRHERRAEAGRGRSAALRCMRRSTDLPAPLSPVPHSYDGLRSGASVPDPRTPKQRALDALKRHYEWDR